MLIITHKYTIIHGCVGKKTALLQTLVLCRLVRFANVLFCPLAVHYIAFSFCLYATNCPLCRSPLHLALTDGTICSWGLRVAFLSNPETAFAGCGHSCPHRNPN